jgi:RimJ/RimL family protein N-acetyltransferase
VSSAEELNIQIKRISPERDTEAFEAIQESLDYLLQVGMFHPEITLDEFIEISKNVVEAWDKDETYLFQIIDITLNQIVGAVMFTNVNRNHKMANLRYWVRTSRTGEGIATKAAKSALRYGFEKLGLHRIEIVVAEDNKPSLRIAEKLGAGREGLLRNRLLIQGTSYDAYMHSLIPEDIE